MPLSRLIGMLYIVAGAIGLLLLFVIEPLRRSNLFNDPNVLMLTVALFLFQIAVGCYMAIPRITDHVG